ncbi:hypothetical protein [Paenibacillus tundrae]|uniref:MFS transporter n=1 Tax=Paenibacillus tundrae TaxID=528187 RepID=A0ABT9WH54_9BACL|nr:hypothetical protein [Paenibacillus tundrae]MDQ0172533.1 hypothetical protein [Paenibacillus tundrae]
MSTYGLIQEQRRIQPFYWIFTQIMSGLGMLIALAMIVGPIYLVTIFTEEWLWLTLILLPLGLWLFYVLWRALRRYAWKNRHLDRVEMDDYQVRYIQWNPETQESEEDAFDRSAIQQVYMSRYTMKNAHFYQKANFGEHVMLYQFLPEIHIIYRQGMQNKICTVRFYEGAEAKAWLDELSSQEVPLTFTMYSNAKLGTEEFRAGLEEDPYLEEASWTGNVLLQYESYHERRMKLILDRIDSARSVQRKRKQKRAARKNVKAFRNVGWAWLVFALQWGIAILLKEQAEQGNVNPVSSLIPIVVYVVCGVLFGFLTTIFVWKHVLIYCIFTAVNLIIISVSFYASDDMSAGARMLDTMGVVSFLGVLFVALPLIAYQYRLTTRKGLLYKNEDQSSSTTQDK